MDFTNQLAESNPWGIEQKKVTNRSLRMKIIHRKPGRISQAKDPLSELPVALFMNEIWVNYLQLYIYIYIHVYTYIYIYIDSLTQKNPPQQGKRSPKSTMESIPGSN